MQSTRTASVAYETPVDGFHFQPTASAMTSSTPGDAVQPTSTAEEASRCQGVEPAYSICFGPTSLTFGWDVDPTSYGRFWRWVEDPTALCVYP